MGLSIVLRVELQIVGNGDLSALVSVVQVALSFRATLAGCWKKYWDGFARGNFGGFCFAQWLQLSVDNSWLAT